MLIAHEPNKLFYEVKVMRILQRLLTLFFAMKKRLFVFMGQPSTSASSHDSYGKIYRGVNMYLKKNGFADKDLTPGQIQQYVDVHSPTASGKIDMHKGFSPWNLKKMYFKAYATVYIETSAHLGKFSSGAGMVLKVFERILRGLFPRRGSKFVFVVKKPLKMP